MERLERGGLAQSLAVPKYRVLARLFSREAAHESFAAVSRRGLRRYSGYPIIGVAVSEFNVISNCVQNSAPLRKVNGLIIDCFEVSC